MVVIFRIETGIVDLPRSHLIGRVPLIRCVGHFIFVDRNVSSRGYVRNTPEIKLVNQGTFYRLRPDVFYNAAETAIAVPGGKNSPVRDLSLYPKHEFILILHLRAGENSLAGGRRERRRTERRRCGFPG